jgi:hypothetical protein
MKHNMNIKIKNNKEKIETENNKDWDYIEENNTSLFGFPVTIKAMYSKDKPNKDNKRKIYYIKDIKT